MEILKMFKNGDMIFVQAVAGLPFVQEDWMKNTNGNKNGHKKTKIVSGVDESLSNLFLKMINNEVD